MGRRVYSWKNVGISNKNYCLYQPISVSLISTNDVSREAGGSVVLVERDGKSSYFIFTPSSVCINEVCTQGYNYVRVLPTSTTRQLCHLCIEDSEKLLLVLSLVEFFTSLNALGSEAKAHAV
jgi:hypothetical protein